MRDLLSCKNSFAKDDLFFGYVKASATVNLRKLMVFLLISIYLL
jgi:ABC-type thiamin/hydroxymethylpyrimidine transport system permease subunit